MREPVVQYSTVCTSKLGCGKRFGVVRIIIIIISFFFLWGEGRKEGGEDACRYSEVGYSCMYFMYV